LFVLLFTESTLTPFEVEKLDQADFRELGLTAPVVAVAVVVVVAAAVVDEGDFSRSN
jgi:hypothetical protein